MDDKSSNHITFRYRPNNSPSGVSRRTVLNAATAAGLNETQYIHLALVEKIRRDRGSAGERDVSPAFLDLLTEQAGTDRQAAIAAGTLRVVSSVLDDEAFRLEDNGGD